MLCCRFQPHWLYLLPYQSKLSKNCFLFLYIYIYIYIYDKKLKKQNIPKLRNLLWKLMLNILVVITFFRILNSWKILKYQWMFNEITGEKKVCINRKIHNSIFSILIFENILLLSLWKVVPLFTYTYIYMLVW